MLRRNVSQDANNAVVKAFDSYQAGFSRVAHSSPSPSEQAPDLWLLELEYKQCVHSLERTRRRYLACVMWWAWACRYTGLSQSCRAHPLQNHVFVVCTVRGCGDEANRGATADHAAVCDVTTAVARWVCGGH